MLTVQPFSLNFPFPYWLVTQSTVYSYIIIIKLRQTTEEVMMMRTKYTQSARELAIRAYKVKFFFIFKELLFSADFASCTIMSGLNCKKNRIIYTFYLYSFSIKRKSFNFIQMFILDRLVISKVRFCRKIRKRLRHLA